MSYYTQINGVRYDRSLLDLAARLADEKSELDLEAMQQLHADAMDGGRITETERRTLFLISERHPTQAIALAWLRQALSVDTQQEYEATLARVLRREMGLQTIRWDIPDVWIKSEYAGRDDEFALDLRRAVNAFLYYGRGQLSLSATARRRNDTNADLRKYLNEGVLFAVSAERSGFYEIPDNLDLDHFRVFGLSVPRLSPFLFFAFLLRQRFEGQYHTGYVMRNLRFEELTQAIVIQDCGFKRLQLKFGADDVAAQMPIYSQANFGEALFGALHVGLFNGESSFSFYDLIRNEVWLDPARYADEYIHEYAEDGSLYLLDEQSAQLLPERLAPDLSTNWAFLLKTPKTDAFFVITASRDMGYDASWCDYYIEDLPEHDLRERVLVEQFQLTELELEFPADQFVAQRIHFGPEWLTNGSLLRQVLNTVLYDYQTQGSAFQIVAQIHAGDINSEGFASKDDYRRAVSETIRRYLQDASLRMLTDEIIAGGETTPPDGERLDAYWLFSLRMPRLSDHEFIVAVPRWPGEEELPYNCGFN